MDTPPDFDTGTAEEWFKYFRSLRFIPSMPAEFRRALNEATTATSSKAIITGYAACCLSLHILIYTTINPKALLGELNREMSFPPATLLGLDAERIATAIETPGLTEDLRAKGFKLSPTGTITALPPGWPQPRPPAPRP